MNLISACEDSPLLRFIYHHMSAFLDHPIRRIFNDPVKAVEAAGIQPGMDVLEVGCGSGYFTLAAATLVGDEGHLDAIDIHPKAVETVSRRVIDSHQRNVIITKTDALDTGFPSESYDLIMLFGVIPAPVLPLQKLLPEMHRLLKPHGSIAVWTGLPLWSSRTLTKSRLFTYAGKRNGVHNFTKLASY
jgi:demethylmenaquinone methyltransferase/2-methoxy-6-polyprenyl-1,4-benzoquinol methylase